MIGAGVDVFRINFSHADYKDVEERITAFMQRELLGPDVPVGRDDDLLSGERVDELRGDIAEAFHHDAQTLLVAP